MKRNRGAMLRYASSTKLFTIFLLVSLALTAFAGPAFAQADPLFKVDRDVHLPVGDGNVKIWVPVKLETSSLVSSAAFALNYDESCLAFDAVTDSSNSGVPDSVVQTHGGFIYQVRIGDINKDSRNEILVLVSPNASSSSPILPTMDLAGESYVLTKLQFSVLENCRTLHGTVVPVDFEFAVNTGNPRVPSVSDETGKSILGPPKENHIYNGQYTLHFDAEPDAVKIDGLDAADIAEDLPAGTLIGQLSTVNYNPDYSYFYSLANNGCSGAVNDNYAFKINGADLLTKAPYDYEDDVVTGTDHLFTACVRSTDSSGVSIDSLLTINVLDVNEPGAAIELDNTEVYELSPTGTIVGNLSTTGDPDFIDADLSVPDSHTYALTTSIAQNCLGPDNASFQINGDLLVTATTYDISVKDLYQVCISSTDTGNNVLHKSFYITIVDSNEPPVAVDDIDKDLVLADTSGSHLFDVLANDYDPDPYDQIYVRSLLPVAGPIIGGSIKIVDSFSKIEFTPQPGYSGPVSFQYNIDDKERLPSQEYATVSFWVVNDNDRGDCNNDTFIDAADFSATQLEMWDSEEDVTTDGKPDWRRIDEGGYPGSPIGCDSNKSQNGLTGMDDSVDVADVTCTVRLFFGETCDTIMASAVGVPDARLKVGENLVLPSDGSVQVPIILDSAGQNIAAAGFWVRYDPTLLAVTDDSVTTHSPEGVVTVVDSSKPGVIKVALFGVTMPFSLLQDGVLATINLESKSTFIGNSPIDLVESETSLSNEVARSLPVVIADGYISGEGSSSIYLPQLTSRMQ